MYMDHFCFSYLPNWWNKLPYHIAILAAIIRNIYTHKCIEHKRYKGYSFRITFNYYPHSLILKIDIRNNFIR